MDEKHNLLDTLRKFWKNFFRKLVKMHYISILFKKVNKPCVNFLRVWTKNANCWEILRKIWKFWWKYYRKFEFFFIFYLENLLLKIEPSEITPFFYSNFFGFGGGGFPPFLPLATRLTWSSNIGGKVTCLIPSSYSIHSEEWFL